MEGVGIAFMLGLVLGLLLGLWTGGRRVLSKMYRDDVQKARDSRTKRRGTFL